MAAVTAFIGGEPVLPSAEWVPASSSSELLYIHRDHKDYEGRGAGEPRTATSTFTQLLSSVAALFSSSMLLYVHRDQDVHLDFHTASEL